MLCKVKTGPFAEHSNQLYNISGVPAWSKVNSGLIKMYKAEVKMLPVLVRRRWWRYLFNGFPGQSGKTSTMMSPFWILLELPMMEVVVTTGAIKICKAPVKSSPLAKHHPAFYRLDTLPVSQPTVSKHWREKVSHSMDLLTPKLTSGSSDLVFDHQSFLVTLGRVAVPLVSPNTLLSVLIWMPLGSNCISYIISSFGYLTIFYVV